MRRLCKTSLSYTKFVAASLIILVFAVGQAPAALEVQDYLNPGDGLITFDTDTGLEWLDVSQTVNVSYDDMLSRLGNMSDPLYGWSMATPGQLNTLFMNAGISDSTINQPADTDPAYDSKVRDLMDLLSPTIVGDVGGQPAGATRGWTLDSFEWESLGNYEVAQLSYIVASNSSRASDGSTGQYFGAVRSAPDVTIGSFLIRDAGNVAVPEPSSVLVWTVLLGAGLVLGRRYRHQLSR